VRVRMGSDDMEGIWNGCGLRSIFGLIMSEHLRFAEDPLCQRKLASMVAG